MADIDLKTATPDTSLPTTGFLFGADSQASASPSVYSTQTVATTLLGSTSLTGATITTSQPVLDLAQTWNASGVTFTAIKMNVTNTASAAASSLIELQLGSKGVFRVTKGGALMINSDLTSALGVGTLYLFKHPSSSNDVYVQNNGETELRFGIQGQQRYAFGVSGQTIRADTALFWSASPSDVGGVVDLILTRRAAANLRLGAADVGATTATVTITIAAPGVVTWTSHGFSTGTPVVFTTTGALPTGITAGTTYYAVVVDANTFQIASSVANAIATPATVITTSGTQSGTHTGTRYNITQRLGMQSVTGVTDRLGADLLIQGSQGTGTGAGGSIIFQVAPAGSSGTAQNALVNALTIDSGRSITIGGAWNDFQFRVPGGGGSRAFTVVDGSTACFTTSTSGTFFVNSFGLGSNIAVPDVQFWRDNSDILALRRGANPQRLNIYGTYTAADNFERLFAEYNAAGTAFRIGTEKGTSGGTARALEFQTDGTTRLTIAATGQAVFSAGSTSAPSISFSNTGSGTGFWGAATSQVSLSLNGTEELNFQAGTIWFKRDLAVGSGFGVNFGATGVTTMGRDGANYCIAAGNGANAFRFSVYNTYTNATTFERYDIDWRTTANTVLVGPTKGSSGGTQRTQRLQYLEDGGTGSTTPSLGTTCPAASATIKSWIKVVTSDGTTGYIPCWA